MTKKSRTASSRASSWPAHAPFWSAHTHTHMCVDHMSNTHDTRHAHHHSRITPTILILLIFVQQRVGLLITHTSIPAEERESKSERERETRQGGGMLVVCVCAAGGPLLTPSQALFPPS